VYTLCRWQTRTSARRRGAGQVPVASARGVTVVVVGRRWCVGGTSTASTRSAPTSVDRPRPVSADSPSTPPPADVSVTQPPVGNGALTSEIKLLELKQNRAMPPSPILWSAGGIMFSTCPYRCACVRPGRRHYPTGLRSIFRVSSDVGKQSIVDHCKEKTQ